MGFDDSRASAPSVASTIASTMPPTAMISVNFSPAAMNLMLSRIHSRSKPAATKNSPSTTKMTAHTAATFRRNGIRALASASRSSGDSAESSAGHCWTVRSTPSNHCSEKPVRVPSSCISPTIASTASTRLAGSSSEDLSMATASGS